MVPRVSKVCSTWARGSEEADPPLWLCSKHCRGSRRPEPPSLLLVAVRGR